MVQASNVERVLKAPSRSSRIAVIVSNTLGKNKKFKTFKTIFWGEITLWKKVCPRAIRVIQSKFWKWHLVNFISKGYTVDNRHERGQSNFWPWCGWRFWRKWWRSPGYGDSNKVSSGIGLNDNKTWVLLLDYFSITFSVKK